jgi:fluoroquinolone resistance protein
MELLIYDDKTFEGLAYTQKVVKGREFQSCTFKNCDFSESDFSRNKFIDCVFDACNLSMIRLSGSTLNDVLFKNCKILGVIFNDTQNFLFSVKFDACILDYASFMDKKMPKTKFTGSSLKETTFSGAILTGSSFDESDLLGAVFNHTDLTEVNFVSAFNYNIDPELNTIKKAVFSSQGLAALLSKYQIKIV